MLISEVVKSAGQELFDRVEAFALLESLPRRLLVLPSGGTLRTMLVPEDLRHHIALLLIHHLLADDDLRDKSPLQTSGRFGA